MKIGILSTNRADYSILKPLIKILKKNYNVKLVTTGAHFSKKHGNTYQEIVNDKIKIDKKIKIDFSNKFEKNTIDNLFSETFSKFFLFLKKSKFNYMIVLGDRFEVFSVSLCCHFLNIPIIHLYGGEATSGSLDNVFRDLISKLSKFHFVSNVKYKKKLIKDGFSKKKIFVVGSLAIDNIKECLSQQNEIDKNLVKFLKKKNILITFHPATIEKVSFKNQISNLLLVLRRYKDLGIIFTSTNIDQGGNEITKMIKKFIKDNKNSKLIKSLGGKNYYRLLKKVNCVVGNSSSGIMEAPYLKTPTINIGKRQHGRLMSSSIINTDYSFQSINFAIKKILNSKKSLKYKNYYGQGKSAEKINRIFSQII